MSKKNSPRYFTPLHLDDYANFSAIFARDPFTSRSSPRISLHRKPLSFFKILLPNNFFHKQGHSLPHCFTVQVSRLLPSSSAYRLKEPRNSSGSRSRIARMQKSLSPEERHKSGVPEDQRLSYTVPGRVVAISALSDA